MSAPLPLSQGLSHHFPEQQADLGRQDPKPLSCISLHLDSVRRAAFRSSTVLTGRGKGQKGDAKDKAPLKKSEPEQGVRITR